jgi:hypothetical protein
MLGHDHMYCTKCGYTIIKLDDYNDDGILPSCVDYIGFIFFLLAHLSVLAALLFTVTRRCLKKATTERAYRRKYLDSTSDSAAVELLCGQPDSWAASQAVTRHLALALFKDMYIVHQHYVGTCADVLY